MPAARDLSIDCEMKKRLRRVRSLWLFGRVNAELRHRGIVLNAKKIAGSCAEHAPESREAQAFIRDDG